MLNLKPFIFSILLISSIGIAHSSCNEDIDSFFNNYAPHSKEITIKGKYTKKSYTGEKKECELSLKKNTVGLQPSWEPEKLDPNNGDGGGIWPFGIYPTETAPSNRNGIGEYFKCNADAENFSIDYSYKADYNWFKTIRSSLSVKKIDSEIFEVRMRDGRGGSVITCRGKLTEKSL